MAINYVGNWNDSRRKTTEGAMSRILSMITKALISCKAVQRDAEARAKYIAHFGDLTQLGTVQTCLGILERRIGAPGSDINVNLQMTLPAGVVLPAGATWDMVEAYATPGAPAGNVAASLTVCPAFFTGDLYVSRVPGGRTGAGTVIHELSHACFNTADHFYSHQPAYAAQTAAQMATNADNYREYCQSFDVI